LRQCGHGDRKKWVRERCLVHIRIKSHALFISNKLWYESAKSRKSLALVPYGAPSTNLHMIYVGRGKSAMRFTTPSASSCVREFTRKG